MPPLSDNNRLPTKSLSQNSRVNVGATTLPASNQEITSVEAGVEIIEKCYRQIFFHAMKSDRDIYLESQYKYGSVTTRDFIRGLLLSDRFYRGYAACNSNYRIVEQVVGRVLGRPVYGEDEQRSWAIVIAERGFTGFVDAILDCPEYIDRFGYDGVPEQVNRTLPGRAIGEIPIYQSLPRYGESWRDRLIQNGMMMSVAMFNQLNNTTSVARLIYQKPQGRSLKIWITFLTLMGGGSIVLILSIFSKMFTIR